MQEFDLPPLIDAIVLKWPNEVSDEKIPMPRLESEGEVIIKVYLTVLCVTDSDLPLYCGREDAEKTSCTSFALLGTPSLPGCQAAYVCISTASSCLLLELPHLLEGLARVEAPGELDVRRNGREKRVGLCAITSAFTLFEKVIGVVPTQTRRELASKCDPIPVSPPELQAVVDSAAKGQGGDSVL
nr:hypothetical protein L203_00751 [Cryptococcus depauperatus CBS 7841]